MKRFLKAVNCASIECPRTVFSSGTALVGKNPIISPMATMQVQHGFAENNLKPHHISSQPSTMH